MIELESLIGADPRRTRARPRGADYSDCAGRGTGPEAGWRGTGFKAHVTRRARPTAAVPRAVRFARARPLFAASPSVQIRCRGRRGRAPRRGAALGRAARGRDDALAGEPTTAPATVTAGRPRPPPQHDRDYRRGTAAMPITTGAALAAPRPRRTGGQQEPAYDKSAVQAALARVDPAGMVAGVGGVPLSPPPLPASRYCAPRRPWPMLSAMVSLPGVGLPAAAAAPDWAGTSAAALAGAQG